jgi:hypothetical protein
MSAPFLDRVHLTWASVHAAGTGLLGFVTARYGDLLLDGIAVRRTRDGRVVLSWPSRRDSRGRDHSVVRPCGDDARQALEAAILGALGLSAQEQVAAPRGDDSEGHREKD